MQWVHPFVEWYRLGVCIELELELVETMASSRCLDGVFVII